MIARATNRNCANIKTRSAEKKRKAKEMTISEAIKLYRSEGLLIDNEHDLPAIEALLDAGYTVKWHGQGPYDTAWCTVVELERWR